LKYRIEYSPDTEDHFRILTTRQQVTVLDTVEKTRRPNPVAPWELRIGNLRVYYDIEDDPEHVVYIRAIGIKAKNNVRIGKEVIRL